MDVNVYGDALVSSTCRMTFRKATDSERVMVWNGISIDGRMDLAVVRGNLTAAEYIEQKLLQDVLVAAYGVCPEFLIMHDNTRAHVVCITRAALRELEIQEMEWSAVRPDFNSFEHVWDRLTKSLR